MRKCQNPTCGEPIPDNRRKDALYCSKPACRAADFRRRKKEQALRQTTEHRPQRQEQLIVTCSCGNRLLVEVTHLGRADTAPPELPPTAEPNPGAVTRTVAIGEDARVAASDTGAEPPRTVTANGSPPLLAADLSLQPSTAGFASTTPPSLTTEPPQDGPAPQAGTVQPLQPASSTIRWTCELFGVVGGSRIIPLEDALLHTRDGRVSLRPGFALSLGYGRRDGHRLSGSPGCWSEAYPDTSPTVFGLDPDLAIVSWDAQARRAVAVSADTLQQLLGADWRRSIRAMIEGQR